MAGILKVADLEERKRALIAESDAYREVLKVEIQSLQMAGFQFRRRFSTLRPSNPLMMLVLPLLTSFLRRRRSGPKMRLLTAAFFGWKILRNSLRFLARMFARKSRKGHREDVEEEEQSAAM